MSESSLRRAWENPRFRLLVYDEMMSAAPEETIALLAATKGVSPAEVRRLSFLRTREEWLPREINRAGKGLVRVEKADDFIRLLKRKRNRQESGEAQGGVQVCFGSEITASIYVSTGSRETELAISLTSDLEATITSSQGISATVAFSHGGIKNKDGAKLDFKTSHSLMKLFSQNRRSVHVLPPKDFFHAYEYFQAKRHYGGFYLNSICLNSRGASFEVGYGNNSSTTLMTNGSVQLKGVTASLRM